MKLVRRLRFGWLVALLVAAVGFWLAVGSAAWGDSAGPTLAVDQGFNSGQPVAPTFPADYSGGSPGGVLFASVIQPDGKVIVVGQNSNGSVADFDIARYNADGTLDTSFGSGGYVQVAPTANSLNFADAVALDPQNGDIVIAGGDTSASPFVPELVRLTSSGALDSSFGRDGSVVDSTDAGSYLTGLVVDSSHRIVTIGSDGVVRRYTASGAVDSTFGSGGHTGALVSSPSVGSNVLALQPADGKILVAGTSSGAGTVVRLNTDGTLDSTFGSSGTATLAAGTAIDQMTLEGTSVVVGGSDSSGNGMLARLTSSGALDKSFGTASGYDALTPPSGYTEQVDALFYDPGNPEGLIYCLYQTETGSKTGACSSLGVDGQTTGPSVAVPGTPKPGGYSFISNSILAWISYAGVGLDTTKPIACASLSVTDSGIANSPGVAGTAYKASFTASRGVAPYTFALTGGSLPPGLTLSDGTLAGTPNPPGGDFTFTVTATDSTGCTGSETVTLTVFNPAPPPGGSITPACTYGLELRKQAEQRVSYGSAGTSWTPLKAGAVGRGDEMRYFIKVTNSGTCPATNINILDSLPSSLRLKPNGAFLTGGSVTETVSPRGGGSVSADIPTLKPGASAYLDVPGEVSGPGPLDNRASATFAEASSPVLSNPVNLNVTAVPEITSVRAGANGAAGSATAGGTGPGHATDAASAAAVKSSPLAAVYVAIRKFGTGCIWLKSVDAQFRRGACSAPLWLKASGTTHWRLHFQKPLPPGRYALVVQAVNRAGVFDTMVSARKHDLLVFRVR